jgi:hypothetical protein
MPNLKGFGALQAVYTFMERVWTEAGPFAEPAL